jgi:hypothetical protein
VHLLLARRRGRDLRPDQLRKREQYRHGPAQRQRNGDLERAGRRGGERRAGGIYEGLLFYQDPRAPKDTSRTGQLNGGATSSLVGATYFPANNVTWNGNLTGASECTLIIADTVTLTGSSTLSADKCDEFKIKSAVTTKIALIE